MTDDIYLSSLLISTVNTAELEQIIHLSTPLYSINIHNIYYLVFGCKVAMCYGLQQGVRIIGAFWKLRVFCNEFTTFKLVITPLLIIEITQFKNWLVEDHLSFPTMPKLFAEVA